MENKLEGWKAKLLFRRGRVTLLKLVINSLPIYFMSLFKISHGIPDEIKKLQRCFLWGGANNNRGMHFIRWDIVCHEKKNEGLGLVDLETKNRSLLTKWIWRYGNEREHIWRKIVTAKNDYDPHALLPKATVSRNCSKVWKYIISPLISTDKFFLQVKANLGVTIKGGYQFLAQNKNGRLCEFGQ